MLRAAITRAVAAERRRRYFVDPQVQGALLWQAVCYWLWASATFALISFVYRVVPAWLSDAAQYESIWRDLGPYTIASLVLFPIVMFSAIRFSNRFAGPMVRIRRALGQLAHGETPPRLTLRDGDFWLDIANDINVIAGQSRRASPSTPVTANIDTEVCDEDPAGEPVRL
jgi:hypothetical protein